MGTFIKNKNISGVTVSNDRSNSSSNSFSSVRNTSTSNGKSWNTSSVSKGTTKALKNAEQPFSSQYTGYLNSVLDKINNRQDFAYDLNGDALYQQYAEQYKALGNQAMQETMANAASLTGGYGNSYATTAGQQAFNSYLQQLNDIVPDLYAQARSNYDSETNNLYNQADLYAGLENEDYTKWSNDRNYYSEKYNNEWNRNAVSHSSQTDKSTQMERSSSSSSSSGNSTATSYAPKTSSLVLPSYDEIKDASSNYKTAQALLSTYGLSADVMTKGEYKATGSEKTYKQYLSDVLNTAIDAAYTKKSRKKSTNTKGSK